MIARSVEQIGKSSVRSAIYQDTSLSRKDKQAMYDKLNNMPGNQFDKIYKRNGNSVVYWRKALLGW